MISRAMRSSRPHLPYRGVIEGFYGPLWTHEDRLHLLAHMPGWSMNLYIYAPKNDPYHRFRWDAPYPRESMNEFRQLARTAERSRVMLSIAISPGNSFDPGSNAHRQRLMRKLGQFIDLGCRFFPILYDDLHGLTEYESPRAVRHAERQAELMNYFAERIRRRVPRAKFLFCPTQYGTAEKSPYLSRLHELLDPDVETVVTGVDGPGYVIAAHTFSNEGARRYIDHFGRKPFLWDNFNVSDWTPTRLNWTPYTGRGDRLDELCSGIVLNPQNVYRVNLPVFATMGDYFADPRGYDPARSMREHLETLLGRDALDVGVMLSKWYTTEVSGYVSANMNLPPIEELDSGQPLRRRRAALRAIQSAVAPTLDFENRFNATLMSPQWAGHLAAYCQLLKWWSYSINRLVEAGLREVPIPRAVGDEIAQALRELRGYPFQLPGSLLDYMEQAAGRLAETSPKSTASK